MKKLHTLPALTIIFIVGKRGHLGHMEYGYVVVVTRRLSRGWKLCRRVQPYEAEITNHLNFQHLSYRFIYSYCRITSVIHLVTFCSFARFIINSIWFILLKPSRFFHISSLSYSMPSPPPYISSFRKIFQRANSRETARERRRRWCGSRCGKGGWRKESSECGKGVEGARGPDVIREVKRGW